MKNTFRISLTPHEFLSLLVTTTGNSRNNQKLPFAGCRLKTSGLRFFIYRRRIFVSPFAFGLRGKISQASEGSKITVWHSTSRPASLVLWLTSLIFSVAIAQILALMLEQSAILLAAILFVPCTYFLVNAVIIRFFLFFHFNLWGEFEQFVNDLTAH